MDSANIGGGSPTGELMGCPVDLARASVSHFLIDCPAVHKRNNLETSC